MNNTQNPLLMGDCKAKIKIIIIRKEKNLKITNNNVCWWAVLRDMS